MAYMKMRTIINFIIISLFKSFWLYNLNYLIIMYFINNILLFIIVKRFILNSFIYLYFINIHLNILIIH